MTKKRITAVDKEIGRRIRVARMAIGMSTAELASSLNLVRQVIYRYESGIDRISASTLNVFSKKLNVPISYFFDNLEIPVNNTIKQVFFQQAAKYFNKIKDPKAQVRLLKILKSMNAQKI